MDARYEWVVLVENRSIFVFPNPPSFTDGMGMLQGGFSPCNSG